MLTEIISSVLMKSSKDFGLVLNIKAPTKEVTTRSYSYCYLIVSDGVCKSLEELFALDWKF